MQEWKNKMPEMEKDYTEILTEAVAFFEQPKPFNKLSPELEPLKVKYSSKLLEPSTSEEEVAFALTKLLAPLIEGRQEDIYLFIQCILLTFV